MKNLEIGIDLGTTNSEISIIKNGDIQVIKNIYGDTYTPSVVGINKAKNIIVGKKAYDALNKFISDEELLNNKAEIKRLMGTKTEIEFTRINKKYKPEEIAAEILKSLKTDVLSVYNDINTKGAVITVPAHFSTVQAEATKRAGQLAGFKKVLLLQEPIAAAIAYGFSKKIDENWLVYDLGGGTFDVALISSKNGDLRVIEHNGDNFLGGKDIDYAIIDTIVIPKLKEKFILENFNRGNEKYNTIFQKIKYNVEQAKIQLSRLEQVEIDCDFEIDGNAIFETIILSRNDLELAANGIINKTIALCHETIKNSGIDKKNINRVILVGGPTQLPCIRNQLANSIGIFVDTTVDPLTAISKGACIYAAGQQIEDDEDNIIDENIYKINLYYESLSAEDEELIVGEIPELKGVEKDYYIQIQNTNNSFCSEKIKVQDSKFKIYIPLEERKLNSFWIYLIDENGVSLQLSQDGFNITQGLNIVGAPLPKSIGLLFFEEDLLTQEKHNSYEIVFYKNSILPISKTIRCKTAKTIKKGKGKENLGIYVYEGESEHIDRNMEICSLEINGEEIFSNILSNSDVEIKLSVDESRTLDIKAYFPDLDQEFNARSSIYDPDISIEELQNEFKDIVKNFNNIKYLCNKDESESLINEINDIQRDLQSAQINVEDKCKANNRLKMVKISIDNLSIKNSYEKIYGEFQELISQNDRMKELCTDDTQKKLLQDLYQKGKEAQKQNNVNLLAITNQELSELHTKLLFNDKNFLLALFSDLYHNKNLKNNPNTVEYFENFMSNSKQNNIKEMKKNIRSLIMFLPQEEKNETEQKFSGIRKI